MRLFIAATVAATLFATNLLAAEAVAPLPAGKPAGVQKAQDADNTVWWIVGLGAVAAGIAIVASGNSSTSATSTTTS
jgi:hypothetical protein